MSPLQTGGLERGLLGMTEADARTNHTRQTMWELGHFSLDWSRTHSLTVCACVCLCMCTCMYSRVCVCVMMGYINGDLSLHSGSIYSKEPLAPPVQSYSPPPMGWPALECRSRGRISLQALNMSHVSERRRNRERERDNMREEDEEEEEEGL